MAKCFDTNAENVATECCVQFIRLEFQKVHLDRSQNNYQSPLEQFNSILASPVVFISPARETDGVWKDFSATAAKKMNESPEFDVECQANSHNINMVSNINKQHSRGDIRQLKSSLTLVFD